MMHFHTFPLLTEKAHMEGNKISLQRIHPTEDMLHGHEFLELVYVMDGSAMHQLGAGSHPLTAGDYLIIERGSVHRYTELHNFTIVNCLFMPEFVDRALSNCPTLSVLFFQELHQLGFHNKLADQVFHDSSGSIRLLVESMEAEYLQRQVGWQEMLRCRLVEILVCTERVAENTLARRQHPAVAAMVEYVHDHCAEPLSLSALSKRLGYTSQYLCSLFHRETGMTLRAYLQHLRMERSCHLLLNTDARISQIAQAVGYSDQKHFNQLFRRHTGFSPREFRSRGNKSKGANHA